MFQFFSLLHFFDSLMGRKGHLDESIVTSDSIAPRHIGNFRITDGLLTGSSPDIFSDDVLWSSKLGSAPVIFVDFFIP